MIHSRSRSSVYLRTGRHEPPVTPRQRDVLAVVAKHPNWPLARLGEELRITTKRVWEHVEALERRGLLFREPLNGRQNRLVLTEDGIKELRR